MAQWHRNNPWRQGHLLAAETTRALGLSHSETPSDTAVVVISHDCDLAQDTSAEPNCEIVIGRKIASVDGNFANAKSIRKLHLPFSKGDGTTVPIELEAAAKTAIKKDQIASHLPDASILLHANEATILQAWLAARYRRASFADEFDQRLTKNAKKAYEKLLRIFKATSEDIIAVFFDVDQGAEVIRKGPDDVYELVIYLLYSVDKDPEKAKQAATKAAADITRIFKEQFESGGRWQNIELIDCQPISEETMTVRMDRVLKRWNLDYISLKEDHLTLN
jgi:hypothetical protein